jgi:hypothetical protein
MAIQSILSPRLQERPKPTRQYPSLPPPGHSLARSHHPLDPRSIQGFSRTRRSVEMFVHGLQSLISMYGMLNTLSTLHFLKPTWIHFEYDMVAFLGQRNLLVDSHYIRRNSMVDPDGRDAKVMSSRLGLVVSERARKLLRSGSITGVDHSLRVLQARLHRIFGHPLFNAKAVLVLHGLLRLDVEIPTPHCLQLQHCELCLDLRRPWLAYEGIAH